MRYLAILFFGHLAATATAANYATQDEVNYKPILNEYEAGVNALPIPSLEYGDRSARKFRDSQTENTEGYGTDVMDVIARQAIEVGDELISDLQTANKKLQRSIEPKASRETLNDDLQELTNQLETILKLNPGKSKVPSPVLPPIPKQPIELVPRTTKRTAEELFNNGDSIVNNIASNMLAYSISLFRSGWAYARPTYYIFSSQLRDTILNDKVLAASREVINEVDKQEDLLQRIVLPETWRSYRNAGDRILAAYNLYKASKYGQR